MKSYWYRSHLKLSQIQYLLGYPAAVSTAFSRKAGDDKKGMANLDMYILVQNKACCKS